MGTNYYLRRKCNFNPDNKVAATLGCVDGREHEPIELVNGWVWNRKFYSSIEELNKEFYQEIHIGKSSAGWRFGLCVYPTENPKYKGQEWNEQYLEKPIESLADWVKLFNTKGNVIVDEYGDEVTVENMVDKITHRRCVDGRENLHGWHSLDGTDTTSSSKREYYFINGLLAHKPSRPVDYYLDPNREKWTTIMPDDCTYDLIFSGNDVESGEIFC